LSQATWTKVHSLAADNGWRPFARASNLSVAVDMNLGDKKLKLDRPAAWDATHAAMAPAAASAFPALLYDFAPQRSAGQLPLAQPLNPQVGQWYAASCRWGGCHPPREPWVEWPGWLASTPRATDGAY